jgi:hypothetical protein
MVKYVQKNFNRVFFIKVTTILLLLGPDKYQEGKQEAVESDQRV